MKKLFLFLYAHCLAAGFEVAAQDFYAIDTIQSIEISFIQPNWDYILDTAKQGQDGYTIAQWVKINGVQYDSVGVKYKGNSSYNPGNAKNPLHIELDYVKNQDYQGYKDIKLSNGYHEPSFIREALLYRMLQKYMQASSANFAQVQINGQSKGLFTNVEAVTKTFVESRFYSNNNSFFFADNVGCNLRYKGPDSVVYYPNYTIKSDLGWGDLIGLCSTLQYNINGIENVLDVDRALWMLAFTNVGVILDSYLGNATHNYYIYEDHHGRFNSIIWDLNGGLGIFNRPGGMPDFTVAEMQNMSPLLHANDSLWPLVKKLLSVPMYKRMYIAHMKTVLNENYSDSSYYYDALYLQTIIDTAVQSDPVKFYTYAEFISNLNNTIIDGPKTIPGICLLMEARISYLNSTFEFMQVPPTITNIQPSDTFPAINSQIYITAQISNTTAAYCGYRSGITDKFTRASMLDNGLNGDGTAGDGIYGITLNISTPELQYYIYSENNNAGIFSPERAEHEWYTITSDYSGVSSGQIVINEIMAVNTTTQANGLGNFNDWVELYNNTPDTKVLDNLYLSDNINIPTQWQFPAGTTIPGYSFLIIWADNDSYVNELHTGFKLSGIGEELILSYGNGDIIDSLTYAAQISDITWGRYPNGTGNFTLLLPTFNATNQPLGVGETANPASSIIYPNPAESTCFIETQEDFDFAVITTINSQGMKILSQTFINNEIIKMDVSELASGIYFVILQTENTISTMKMTVIH